MNADGSNTVRLTNTSVDERKPRFSPDGSKIVFARIVDEPSGTYFRIFTMNADGSNAVQLTMQSPATYEDSPSYSPDGTKIVFHRLNLGSFISQAAVMNTNGSGQGAFFQNFSTEGQIYSPAFSPDGTKIIYHEQSTFSSPIRFRVVACTISSSRKDYLADNGEFPSWQPLRPSIVKTPFDFDGDRKTDISIYRPSTGAWRLNRSSNNSTITAQFGTASDNLVPSDFTGDGKTDIAYFRPSTGQWIILCSEDNNSYYGFPFGSSTDIPTPGDYDGDGKADAAVFRSSNSSWYLLRSTAGFLGLQFGDTGDQQIPNVFVR